MFPRSTGNKERHLAGVPVFQRSFLLPQTSSNLCGRNHHLQRWSATRTQPFFSISILPVLTSAFIRECRLFLLNFTNFRMNFVRREAKNVVHTPAKASTFNACSYSFDSIPTLYSIFDLDWKVLTVVSLKKNIVLPSFFLIRRGKEKKKQD